MGYIAGVLDRAFTKQVPVARRNILADRRRFAVSVLGVGASLALVLLLQGLWGGMRAQISAFVDNSGAQVFVGDRDMSAGGVTSLIPTSTVARVRATGGVAQADPVISRYAVVRLHGRRQFLSVIGYEPGGLGAPWRLAQGRTVTANDEVVVDRVLATEHHIELNDTFDVMGKTLRVVGLSSGTRSWMTGYVFVTHDAAQAAFGIPGQTSFVLIRTNDERRVEDQLRRIAGVSFLPRAGLAEKMRQTFAKIIKPIIDLMILIAFAAGTIIVALTVYSAVVERLREYGIARALGSKSRRLFRVVFGQTAALTSAGIVAGYGMYWVFGWVITALRPKFWLLITPRDVLEVALGALLMAFIAAIFPTRRLTRVDPASVYREA